MYRRDLLRAVTVPVVAGATGALSGWVHGTAPADRLPIAKGSRTALTSRPLMTVRIVAAPPQKLGPVPRGIRSIVPVMGGDFEGSRLRGKVLPGGADWLLLRGDDVLEFDLRITLETDDHALIYMRFHGLRHGHYFRTLPAFETSTDRYAFLNRIITVGVGEGRPDGAVHRIDEIL
jgi:uncharacterized protein DUF3237